MSLVDRTPCIGDPIKFDCRDCSVGPDAPCKYRTDETLRHERAERISSSGGHGESEVPSTIRATLAAKEVLKQQRMALPVTAILGLLPNELAISVEPKKLESLLRRASDVHESSPRMFKWQGNGTPPVTRRITEDLSSGASIARMVASYPPFPSKIRRAKFKRLSALRHLREFDRLDEAREAITVSVNRILPIVLKREGWRIADAVAFATNGSLVPLAHDSGSLSQSERRKLLLGILALDTLVEFDSVEESYVELRAELLSHNLGLVASIARKYASGQFLQYADLFQSGIEGLYTAIERYDPYLGYEFSTYASQWLRQSITRTIANEERVIRLPVHIVATLEKLQISEINLFSRLARKPTFAELSE